MAASSQLQKAAAVQRGRLLRVSSATWDVPSKAPRRGRHARLGEWIDVVGLSGFDQRSDDGVVLGAASEPAKSAFFRLRWERSTERCRTRYGRQGSALVPPRRYRPLRLETEALFCPLDLACTQVQSARGAARVCVDRSIEPTSGECLAATEPLPLQTVGFSGQGGVGHEIRLGLAGSCECVGDHAGQLRRMRTWSKPGVVRQAYTVGSAQHRAEADRNTTLVKEGEFESPEMIAAIEKNREDRERTVVMDR